MKNFSSGSLAGVVEPGGSVPFGVLPPRPPLVGAPRAGAPPRPLVGAPVVPPRVGVVPAPPPLGVPVPIVPPPLAVPGVPPPRGAEVPVVPAPRLGVMPLPRVLPPLTPPPRPLGGMILSPGSSSTTSGNEVRAHRQARPSPSFRRRQLSRSFVSELATPPIHSPLSYPMRQLLTVSRQR